MTNEATLSAGHSQASAAPEATVTAKIISQPAALQGHLTFQQVVGTG